MFPVYVCYDDGVTVVERKAIECGLLEIEPLLGSDTYCYGTEQFPQGRYRSANSVVKSTAMNKSGQLNISILLDKLEDISAGWGEPNAMVLFTSADLCFPARNLPYCFGAARHNTRVSVQSVKRFRHLSEELESFCIRRTLRHELGHIYHCAGDLRRSNTVDIAGAHCKNRGCSMRQAGSVEDLLSKMADEHDKMCFCDQCMADLRQFKRNYEASVGKVIAPSRGNKRAARNALSFTW